MSRIRSVMIARCMIMCWLMLAISGCGSDGGTDVGVAPPVAGSAPETSGLALAPDTSLVRAAPLPTTMVTAPEPSVPATGGPPREQPVGRVDGQLELDGHLVLVGHEAGVPAGRIVNLATDEVTAFGVDFAPHRFDAIAPIEGGAAFVGEDDIARVIDTETLVVEAIGPAEWVATSDEPSRFWVGEFLDDESTADWVETDATGATYRSVRTTGSIDPRISIENGDVTLHVGDDLRPLAVAGAWPVGRIGTVALIAECVVRPEVPPDCPVHAFDTQTGVEVDVPIANDHVSAGANMDQFVVSPTERYLLSALYRNDYFVGTVIDLETGESILDEKAFQGRCGGTASTWSTVDPAVVTCGGLVTNVETGEFVQYGLGLDFAVGLAFFTD